MQRKTRPQYIDYTRIKLAALIHCIIGSLILVVSGFLLFLLPAYAFYLTFLIGFYFFLPGVVISFGLVGRKTARSWSRYMFPFWRWMA